MAKKTTKRKPAKKPVRRKPLAPDVNQRAKSMIDQIAAKTETGRFVKSPGRNL